MKLSVLRTIPGKYSGRDHNGDLYFTDDEDVVVEYEYEIEDFIEYLFESYKVFYNIKKTIVSLLEGKCTVEEAVEGYAKDFAWWLDKERE